MIAEQSSSVVAKRPLLGNNAISSHLRDLGHPEKSIKSMEKCGLENGYYLNKAHPRYGLTLIRLEHRCNLRTCGTCSKARKRRLRRHYMPLLMHHKPDRKYSLKFLTISPKNYKTYDEGLKHIRKSWSKFIRREWVKERIKGGLFVIEGKQSEDSTWNVHIHAIIYSRKLDNVVRGQCQECNQSYMKYDKKSRKYYCASRKCNSTNVIIKEDSKLVREWKTTSDRKVNMMVTQLKTTSHTLNYLLKYVGVNKDDFNDDKARAQYIYHTGKRRLITTFGIFFRAKKKWPDLFKKKLLIDNVSGLPIRYFRDYAVSMLLMEIEKRGERPPDMHTYLATGMWK